MGSSNGSEGVAGLGSDSVQVGDYSSVVGGDGVVLAGNLGEEADGFLDMGLEVSGNGGYCGIEPSGQCVVHLTGE